VDLDFHQGDGTALIFKNEPRVFTLSVHSAEGWPDKKQKSDMDIEIFENEENLYLEKTVAGIEKTLSEFTPDLVLFVAGSDP
ncbi:histone deacetylase, partial [Acinetobacter baumannii]